MNQKGVSNNSFWRDKSDKLDKYMGWEGDRKYQSGARGFIHGAYHEIVSYGKLACGNVDGFKAEMGRACEQYKTGFQKAGRTPPKK